MRADLFWDQGGEGRVRGLSLKPAARKIKRKTETMSLSPCESKMTAEMTAKNFSPYWFHASIYIFSFPESSHPIYRHLEVH